MLARALTACDHGGGRRAGRLVGVVLVGPGTVEERLTVVLGPRTTTDAAARSSGSPGNVNTRPRGPLPKPVAVIVMSWVGFVVTVQDHASSMSSSPSPLSPVIPAVAAVRVANDVTRANGAAILRSKGHRHGGPSPTSVASG
jgi:hypothetical protein